jgi:NADH-quinone oxidoreductase subunit H
MSGVLDLLAGTAATIATAATGAYVVAVLEGAMARVVAGEAVGWRRSLAAPARGAARLLLQQQSTTERPDAPLWIISPAILAGLASVILALVPLGPGGAFAEVDAGIVAVGAAAALVMVTVYIHGWAPNSVLPLIGGYRFVALALSYEMPLALVLIAAALPAESLRLSTIVTSQAELWNVLRQPLGLPLYLVAGLGLAFRGPLNLPDAPDLTGGTAAEAAGVDRLLWEAARAAMLVAVAAVGATVFLGGWLGPWLPGPVWLALKTLVLLVLLLTAEHLLARVRLERFVVVAWAVLIPLALVDVFLSGMLAL